METGKKEKRVFRKSIQKTKHWKNETTGMGHVWCVDESLIRNLLARNPEKAAKKKTSSTYGGWIDYRVLKDAKVVTIG